MSSHDLSQCPIMAAECSVLLLNIYSSAGRMKSQTKQDVVLKIQFFKLLVSPQLQIQDISSSRKMLDIFSFLNI